MVSKKEHFVLGLFITLSIFASSRSFVFAASQSAGGNSSPSDWVHFNPKKFEPAWKLVPAASLFDSSATMYSKGMPAFPHDPSKTSVVYGRGKNSAPTVIYAHAHDILNIGGKYYQAPAAGQSLQIVVQNESITIYGTSFYTPLSSNSFVANPAQVAPFEPRNIFYKEKSMWPAVIYGVPGQDIYIAGQKFTVPSAGKTESVVFGADGKLKSGNSSGGGSSSGGASDSGAPGSGGQSASSASGAGSSSGVKSYGTASSSSGGTGGSGSSVSAGGSSGSSSVSSTGEGSSASSGSGSGNSGSSTSSTASTSVSSLSSVASTTGTKTTQPKSEEPPVAVPLEDGLVVVGNAAKSPSGNTGTAPVESSAGTSPGTSGSGTGGSASASGSGLDAGGNVIGNTGGGAASSDRSSGSSSSTVSSDAGRTDGGGSSGGSSSGGSSSGGSSSNGSSTGGDSSGGDSSGGSSSGSSSSGGGTSSGSTGGGVGTGTVGTGTGGDGGSGSGTGGNTLAFNAATDTVMEQQFEIKEFEGRGILTDDWDLVNKGLQTTSRVHIDHSVDSVSAKLIDQGTGYIPVGKPRFRGTPGDIFPSGSFPGEVHRAYPNYSDPYWEPGTINVLDVNNIKIDAPSGNLVLKRTKPLELPPDMASGAGGSGSTSQSPSSGTQNQQQSSNSGQSTDSSGSSTGTSAEPTSCP